MIQAMADTIRSLPPQQLQLLSQFGDTADEIIEELAQEEDTKCLTPLHLACIKGHADAVGLLMSYGVNPFTMVSFDCHRDSNGESLCVALGTAQWAAWACLPASTRALGQLEYPLTHAVHKGQEQRCCCNAVYSAHSAGTSAL